MTTIDLTSHSIVRALDERLIDLDRAHRTVFNIASPLGLGDIVERAELFARRLAGLEGHTAGWNTAKGLLETLVSPHEQQDRAFWESPLGGVLAWWTGGDGSKARRRMIAEAATGASRQAVHKMIRDGKLVVGGNGDVTAPSLRVLLQRRYPHEVTA